MPDSRKRILITPLDWGLGHATRCIPIIYELLYQNFEVLVASSGDAALLLKEHFPELKHFLLPGYHPVYPANGAMVLKMVQQLPAFTAAIKKENKLICEIVNREKVKVIISDNRYGCYAATTKNIFITHQVHLLMPDDWKWMEAGVNKVNHHMIRQFDECWIPAESEALIPELLKGRETLSAKFIGYLSRLSPVSAPKKYDAVAMVSGPPPQRAIYAALLRQQLLKRNLKALLITGEPGLEKSHQQINQLETVNHLDTTGVNEAMAQTDLVITRSGYSSVMDLMKLGKKAILVPTPGQTEQEYLAKTLREKGLAYSMPQNEFDLEKALTEVENYSGFQNFGQIENQLRKAIKSLL